MTDVIGTGRNDVRFLMGRLGGSKQVCDPASDAGFAEKRLRNGLGE